MVENADSSGLKATKSTLLFCCDPQPLTLLSLDGRTGILRHDLTLQDTHSISF
jgi:hypothetical protein